MGFYELANGCDSCSPIDNFTNVNMVTDNNTSFGTQSNTVQQYNNNIVSSGNIQQGSNIGNMGNGSTLGSMGGQGQRQQNQQQGQQVIQQQPPQPKVVKQVVTTTTTTPLPPVAPVHNTYPKMEGFTNGSSSSMVGNDKNWIVLGLVIFSAMALNECCKYFLNKSLQLNDGSPMYYVAYVVMAILLAMAANKYACS